MLRKIRSLLAIVFFCLITMLFLDFTGTAHAWFGWMAKIQFLPALLALNAGIVVALVLLTLLFGRVYCSIICPLGVFQDLVSWVNSRRKKQKNRFSYSPAINWLRYGMLALFVVSLVAGIGSLTALMAPYSSYGRMVSTLLAPLYQWGNNLLAFIAERVDSYRFYSVDVWVKSFSTMAVVIVTFAIIIVLAWRNGRTYCNTICPVGTVLGFLSRYSLFRITIDHDKCNKCGLCARRCKAACIHSKESKIDYSRCVACMDCIDNCNQGAMSYKWRFSSSSSNSALAQKKDKSSQDARRSFLSATTLFAAGSVLKAQEKKVDGGLAVIEEKKVIDRATPIVPPGALSIEHFRQHCTACQLCVSACTNHVLRPSGALFSLMQPEMSYERGYCRPECTRCADVCPAGAIHPITKAEKSAIQIGHAVWVKENCIPLTDNVSCGNCARHCPSGAIQMVLSDPDNKNSVKIPVIDTEKCIGCGACENLCPSRPFSAIYVEGHERHREI